MRKLAVAMAAFVAACGGAGEESASGGGGGEASRGNARAFAQACDDNSNMGRELCDCISDRARNELSDLELEFLLASISEDEATQDRLRPQLGIESATRVGMFMTRAPGQCAGALPD